MAKKKKKVQEQFHKVKIERLHLCDTADNVISRLRVADFLITQKCDGVSIGLLSEDDAIVADLVASDVLHECCDMLNSAVADSSVGM